MLSPDARIALLLFLLVLFVVKHFLGDYVLQANVPYTMRKTNPTGWALPLAVHCAIHGALTFALLAFPLPLRVAFALSVVDFAVHYAVDYWKAQVHKAVFNSKSFWIGFGLDQMLHYLTYIALAYMATHFY